MVNNLVMAIFIVSNISIIFLLIEHFDKSKKQNNLNNLVETVNNNAKVLIQATEELDKLEDSLNARLNSHNEMMNLTVTMIEALQKEVNVLKEIILKESFFK